MPTKKLTKVNTVMYLRISSVSAAMRPMMGVFGSRPRREGVGSERAALIMKKKIASAKPNSTSRFTAYSPVCFAALDPWK